MPLLVLGQHCDELAQHGAGPVVARRPRPHRVGPDPQPPGQGRRPHRVVVAGDDHRGRFAGRCRLDGRAGRPIVGAGAEGLPVGCRRQRRRALARPAGREVGGHHIPAVQQVLLGVGRPLLGQQVGVRHPLGQGVLAHRDRLGDVLVVAPSARHHQLHPAAGGELLPVDLDRPVHPAGQQRGHRAPILEAGAEGDHVVDPAAAHHPGVDEGVEQERHQLQADVARDQHREQGQRGVLGSLDDQHRDRHRLQRDQGKPGQQRQQVPQRTSLPANHLESVAQQESGEHQHQQRAEQQHPELELEQQGGGRAGDEHQQPLGGEQRQDHQERIAHPAGLAADRPDGDADDDQGHQDKKQDHAPILPGCTPPDISRSNELPPDGPGNIPDRPSRVIPGCGTRAPLTQWRPCQPLSDSSLRRTPVPTPRS